MPWTTKDVSGFTKAAKTDKQKRQWVQVANDALQSCLDEGGSQEECEASAIRQANAVVKEDAMADGQVKIVTETTTVFPSTQTNTTHSLNDSTPEEAAKTKSVSGKPHPAGDFLVVEDTDKPTTWHLPVKNNGTPDHKLMGAAKAALTAAGGHRGQQYSGPGKSKAITKLKALYKAEDMDWEEVAVGLDSMAQKIRNAYYDKNRGGSDIAPEPSYPWIVEVFYQHPDLGNLVIVDDAGALFGIKYEVGEDGAISFDAERRAAYRTYILESDYEEIGKRLNKKQLAQLKAAQETIANILQWADYSDQQEEPVTEVLSESASGRVMGLAEAAAIAEDSIVPLHLDVALIEPGWGNPKDGHFYPKEVLERDATVFEGIKMYETDHRPDEKSTRTWVSTVKEIKGFSDDGAPIGLVSVHDEDFAKRLLALEADGLLDKMECSILAGGMAREGKVGGKKAKVVESITEASSVDWVTRAGAGGRALSLAESGGSMSDENETEIEESEESTEVNISEDEGTETPAPDPVSKEKVTEMLGETNLPDASQARLSEAVYADEDEVDQAIKSEIAYVKELKRSGQPFGMNSDAPKNKPRTDEESADDFNRIMRECGGREV